MNESFVLIHNLFALAVQTATTRSQTDRETDWLTDWRLTDWRLTDWLTDWHVLIQWITNFFCTAAWSRIITILHALPSTPPKLIISPRGPISHSSWWHLNFQDYIQEKYFKSQKASQCKYSVEEMRSALFWHITQRTVAIPYRRFGTTYRTDSLSRNVGKELALVAA